MIPNVFWAKFRGFLGRFPALLNLIRWFLRVAQRIYASFQPSTIDFEGNHIDIGNDLRMRLSYLSSGNYFKNFKRIIKERLKKDSIVFDIGAHVGVTTLLMADQVGEKGCVCSFEPDPRIHRFLAKNVSANAKKQVRIFCTALASDQGVCELYANRYHSGLSSFDKESASVASFPNEDIELIQIKKTTVDHFIAEQKITPDFIKMDCQGAEMEILKGASDFLSSKASKGLVLYLEFFPYAIQKVSKIDDAVEFLHFLEEHRLMICESPGFESFIRDGIIPDEQKQAFVKEVATPPGLHANLLLVKK